jgi:hypothetical protein
LQALEPTSTLPTYCINEAADRFELGKASERLDIFRQLHRESQFVDADDELAHALQLVVSIAPGADHGS